MCACTRPRTEEPPLLGLLEQRGAGVSRVVSAGAQSAVAGVITTRRCGSSPSDKVDDAFDVLRRRRGRSCDRRHSSARAAAAHQCDDLLRDLHGEALEGFLSALRGSPTTSTRSHPERSGMARCTTVRVSSWTAAQGLTARTDQQPQIAALDARPRSRRRPSWSQHFAVETERRDKPVDELRRDLTLTLELCGIRHGRLLSGGTLCRGRLLRGAGAGVGRRSASRSRGRRSGDSRWRRGPSGGDGRGDRPWVAACVGRTRTLNLASPRRRPNSPGRGSSSTSHSASSSPTPRRSSAASSASSTVLPVVSTHCTAQRFFLFLFGGVVLEPLEPPRSARARHRPRRGSRGRSRTTWASAARSGPNRCRSPSTAWPFGSGRPLPARCPSQSVTAASMAGARRLRLGLRLRRRLDPLALSSASCLWSSR